MRYRVKKRWPAVGLALIVFLGALTFASCFLRVDHEGYREVMERANPALSQETELSHSASQQRRGVQKEFWHQKGEQRLQAVLNCSDAVLVYEKEKEEQGIVENMSKIKCMVQEELFYIGPDGKKRESDPNPAESELTPMQFVRYFEAETAKYHYNSKTLEASHVIMKQYILPEHRLPRSLNGYKPEMEGSADALNITMKDKGLNFNADNFHLTK